MMMLPILKEEPEEDVFQRFLKSPNNQAVVLSNMTVSENQRQNSAYHAVSERYDTGLLFDSECFGAGTVGHMMLARERKTQKMRAIKLIQRGKQRGELCGKAEIFALKKLDHPNIIRLYETFEDRDRFYLVLHLCPGGELYHYIRAEGPLPERAAAHIARQLFSAVLHCHLQGLMHRDIKAENIVFENELDKPYGSIRLIDFGDSTQFHPNQYKDSPCGSVEYMAPEIAAARLYSEKVDEWSAGVVTYLMLSGTLPFLGATDKETITDILKPLPPLEGGAWTGVSDEAKDFVLRLLRKDPKQRMGAAEALQHEWLMKNKDKSPILFGRVVPVSPSYSLPRCECLMKSIQKMAQQLGIASRLRAFSSLNKFFRSVLIAAVAEQDCHVFRIFSTFFGVLDRNGCGSLSYEDVAQGLLLLEGEEPPDLEDILVRLDMNASQTIEYTEFMTAVMYPFENTENGVQRAFATLAQDGAISPDSLAEALGHENLNDVFKEDGYEEDELFHSDEQGNKFIPFEEFSSLLKQLQGGKEEVPESVEAKLKCLCLPLPYSGEITPSTADGSRTTFNSPSRLADQFGNFSPDSSYASPTPGAASSSRSKDSPISTPRVAGAASSSRSKDSPISTPRVAGAASRSRDSPSSTPKAAETALTPRNGSKASSVRKFLHNISIESEKDR